MLMSLRRLVSPILLTSLLALPAQAQAAVAPTPAPAEAPAAEKAEEPSLEERRIVAYVASGVAVASLATGVTMGVMAQLQFDCAKDVIACNGGLQNKIVGNELFDVRAEVEQKALFADMAYLFAGAAAVVATVGFLRGFVFVDEAPAEGAAAATLLVDPAVSTAVASAQVQP